MNKDNYTLAAVSTALVAFSYITNSFALKSNNPASTSTMFFAIGFLASLIVIVALKKTAELTLLKKHWKPLATMGLLNALAATFWFYTINAIGPATTGFLIRFVTIFAIILGVFFLKEKLTGKEMVGAILMIGGALIITYADNFVIVGVLTALMSSLFFSSFQLMSKIYVKKITPATLNTFRLLFASLFLFIYAAATSQFALPDATNLVVIGIGSIISTVIGLLLFYKTLEKSDLSKVAAIGALEPFFILVYSFAFFGTVPENLKLLGGMVIMAGVFALIHKRKKPPVHEIIR